MSPTVLSAESSWYRAIAGVGGIGTGMFFALAGNQTLGRNESRPGRLLDVRDYCKLHIIAHYASVLLGADPAGKPFHVLPIGNVGPDSSGARLMEEMHAAGMDLRFVNTVTDKPTLLSVCFQYPDGSGGNITTSASAASALGAADVDAAEPFLAQFEGRYIALAAPEVPVQVRRHLLEVASAHSAFRAAAFTSAEIPFARYSGVLELIDLIALNQDEGQVIAGVPLDVSQPREFLQACSDALLAYNLAMRIVITAGRAGAFAFDGTTWDHCPALPVTVASTAGAGDALFGGILACLAAGIPFARPGEPRTSMADRPLVSALDVGSLLAAFSVTSPHTIHPNASLDALVDFAGRHGLSFDETLRHAFAAR